MLTKKFFLYWLFFLLAFTSCKKDPVVGSNDYKTLGTSAHDLLSASPYILLQVEINYMPGFAPDTATVNNVKNFLSSVVNKPSGIQIMQHQIAASSKGISTLTDVVNWEKKYRTTFTGNDVIAVHVLITDNDYTDLNTLAKSYWNTSICLFGNTIKNNSGGLGQLSRLKLFSTLLEHEFGHLMGLVNQGSPMQTNHIDAANGAHCNNINCLMYYDIETSAPSGLFGSIPSLDANCIADLKANGGK